MSQLGGCPHGLKPECCAACSLDESLRERDRRWADELAWYIPGNQIENIREVVLHNGGGARPAPTLREVDMLRARERYLLGALRRFGNHADYCHYACGEGCPEQLAEPKGDRCACGLQQIISGGNPCDSCDADQVCIHGLDSCLKDLGRA